MLFISSRCSKDIKVVITCTVVVLKGREEKCKSVFKDFPLAPAHILFFVRKKKTLCGMSLASKKILFMQKIKII